MLMALFNSSCFGVTFGLGAVWVPSGVCDRDDEETASVGVVVCCVGDEEGGEIYLTWKLKTQIKNKEKCISNAWNNRFSLVENR